MCKYECLLLTPKTVKFNSGIMQIFCPRIPDLRAVLRHWKHAGARWTVCGVAPSVHFRQTDGRCLQRSYIGN